MIRKTDRNACRCAARAIAGRCGRVLHGTGPGSRFGHSRRYRGNLVRAHDGATRDRFARAGHHRGAADDRRQRRYPRRPTSSSRRRRRPASPSSTRRSPARSTCGGVELYDGPMAAMRTAPIRLGAGSAGRDAFRGGPSGRRGQRTLGRLREAVAVRRRRAGPLMMPRLRSACRYAARLRPADLRIRAGCRQVRGRACGWWLDGAGADPGRRGRRGEDTSRPTRATSC